MRVDLSKDADGTEHYAVIRDAETVRNRERRLASRATDIESGPAAKDAIYVDVLVAQLLEEWSLPLPCPTVERDDHGKVLTVHFDSFEEITAKDYDAIRDAALKVYAEARGITVEPDTDPASPTEPSSS